MGPDCLTPFCEGESYKLDIRRHVRPTDGRTDRQETDRQRQRQRQGQRQRKTDRQTDRHTDRQTDRQADRQTGQTGRQAEMPKICNGTNARDVAFLKGRVDRQTLYIHML